MQEQKATDIAGHLLYDSFTGKHVFRQYEGEGKYTDYDLAAEDIKVILRPGVSLFKEGDRAWVGFSSNRATPKVPPPR